MRWYFSRDVRNVREEVRQVSCGRVFQTRANAVRQVGIFRDQHETHVACVEWAPGSKSGKR